MDWPKLFVGSGRARHEFALRRVERLWYMLVVAECVV